MKEKVKRQEFKTREPQHWWKEKAEIVRGKARELLGEAGETSGKFALEKNHDRETTLGIH